MQQWKKGVVFFLKSYQSRSPTGTNNHGAARRAARRLRAASALPGDSEFTLERKLLKLLVYIYPTRDRTRFKFWKPVRLWAGNSDYGYQHRHAGVYFQDGSNHSTALAAKNTLFHHWLWLW